MKEITLSLLERDVFAAIFHTNSEIVVGIEGSILDEHSYANCARKMFDYESCETWAFQHDYPAVLMRTNELQARVYNLARREPEQYFCFDDLPLSQKFKLFIMARYCDFEEHHFYVDINAIAPACQNKEDLQAFSKLLDKYKQTSGCCLPAVKHSLELAEFLHRNYVTREDFNQVKEWHRWNESEKIKFIFWPFGESGQFPNAFEALHWL